MQFWIQIRVFCLSIFVMAGILIIILAYMYISPKTDFAIKF